jgi:hypothetical protein
VTKVNHQRSAKARVFQQTARTDQGVSLPASRQGARGIWAPDAIYTKAIRRHRHHKRHDERRIWPVLIDHFDLPALRRDVEQLWAEAAHYEALGEPIALQEDLWPMAALARAERKFENPYQSVLAEWATNRPWVTSNDVWEKLGIAREHRPKAARLVGKALRDIGFIRKQCRQDNDPKGCLRGDRFYGAPFLNVNGKRRPDSIFAVLLGAS